MSKQGQTVEEMIEGLQNLVGHGLVVPKYNIVAFTSDGKQKLEIGYDVKNDERFQ